MARKTDTETVWLQSGVIKVGRVGFILTFFYTLNIIASDAWNLIPAPVVLQRWTVAAIMASVFAVIWYAARCKITSTFYYQALLYIYVLLAIGVATFGIYTQRGMASRAVILYAIPLVLAALLRSRAALYATAVLCSAAYSLAAVRYFVVHFGEGYKAELYTEVVFYCCVIFIVAALLNVVLGQAASKRLDT